MPKTKELCNRGRGLSAAIQLEETASHSSITNFLTYWLIENTNYDGAKKSLQFYRGKDYDITEELNEINQKHQSKLVNSTSLNMSYKVKRIFSMAFLKPFSCVGVLYSLTCWTGFDIFQTYMIDTLELSGGSLWMDIGLMPTIVGILGLVTAGNLI